MSCFEKFSLLPIHTSFKFISTKIIFPTIIWTLLFLTPSDSYTQENLLTEANNYYKEGKYALSGKTYDSYFQKNSGNSGSFYNAACAWSLANQKEKALQYLDSAIVYGFSNIKHLESDTDLTSIKRTKKFQTLLQREKQFASKTTIDINDLIVALQRKKVVVLRNKKFINSYGDWLTPGHGIKKVLNSFLENKPKITKDSLLDFSDKTLFIIDGKGKIHLESLKLKKFQITNSRDISGQNKNIPFKDWNIIQLHNIVAEELNWSINGYNAVRFNLIKALNTRIYNSINIDRFNINSCDLTISKVFFKEGMSTAFYSFGTFNQPLENLSISYSSIKSIATAPSIIPFSVYANSFYFTSNTLHSEVTFSSSEASNVYINKNTFTKAVDISKTNFYESNNYIPIAQFKEGFGIEDDFIRPWEEKKKKLLITGDLQEVKDKESFDNLSYTYKLMHTNYRERGDLNSANAAYVKLKDITLSRDYYLYKQNGGFELWVQYRIGKLIKFYTNSSTSPARAIVISFFIVFAFSLFYMFFPSEWDVKSKPKLIADYKAFVEKNDKGYIKPLMILIIGFFKSWLNAFTLSLNSFVTLGFGAIPTTGVARYLTIIQGFLGWFLLSLFTVALINQALA